MKGLRIKHRLNGRWQRAPLVPGSLFHVPPFLPPGVRIRDVIVDFHTHIFPPEVRDRRDEFLQREPTFAEMYTSPKAKLATAEDLLASMDSSGVDVSVALGFAWREHDLCGRHNDYLLEAAARSNGRIVPFCTVNMTTGESVIAEEVDRCVIAGAKGIGELRPESQSWDLNGDPGKQLAELARRHELVLLFHVTEVGGHEYPGKDGLQLGAFYRFALEHTGLSIVGAHFAGGLPFAMPESPQVALTAFADTAARRFLYPDTVYRDALERWGARRLLLGSDFPLVSQRTQLEEVRSLVTDEKARSLALGENAARLLGLEGYAGT